MKLGRLPRARNASIPHMSALVAGKALPAPPQKVNYMNAVPDSSGEYYNDQLGDCTCAAFYHALQVWSANATTTIDSEPAKDALLLYEQSCGYVPGHPDTDQGGVEQEVLKFLLNTGAPVGSLGTDRHKLSAFIEIDPRNIQDVKRAIYEGGVAYIGFNVPAYVMSSMTTPWTTWWVDEEADQTIVGGHAVVLCGYNEKVLRFISWGNKYQMTWNFFEAFCDEAYVLADSTWIQSTGKTIAGLNLAQLEALMQHLA